MDKFKTLEPVKLYTSAAAATSKRFSQPLSAKGGPAPFSFIGRLPVDVHILILTHLSVPDIPAYSLVSRALAKLSRDERVWEARWKAFGVDKLKLSSVLDDLEARSKVQNVIRKEQAPPTLKVDDDDFGDFTSVNAPAEEMGDFVSNFAGATIMSPSNSTWTPPQSSFRAQYIRAHNLLKPFAKALSSPPHAILTALFPAPAPSLMQQALTLRLLALFFCHRVKPLRTWQTLGSSLRAAMDLFGEGLLTAFDTSDSKGDEKAMAEAAEASWAVWDPSDGPWELGRVWSDKHEIFYDHQSKWDPLENFTKDETLVFDAMDAFMTNILSILKEHGGRAVHVFPPESNVLLSFAERLATEVVGEYVTSLLTRAREISNETFLKATAASFKETWRMVDVIVQVSSERSEALVPRTRAEDVVYRMFEQNMDEYLDEEVDYLKQCFEMICRGWDRTVRFSLACITTTTDSGCSDVAAGYSAYYYT
ncbi:hypothetical protein NM688_g5218 [Phlebia brevispora]|uniref:Uncharacterized protein n=1 Tax=Phlebia brevispora TaxID=194682 RepID=A0ACC1SYT8_9APHY|nr:hypothetical protein NM688_g5218 [Phlebia brevispora]